MDYSIDTIEYFYENRLYICEDKYLKIYDLKRKCYEENIEITDYFRKVLHPNFVDGKFYYGVSQGHNVKLFSFDPKTRKEEEILYFMHKDDLGWDGVFINIDDKNIYCENYVIPRDGGNMREGDLQKGGDAWYYDNMSLFNTGDRFKKYLFYLDDNYKVHRVNRKTGKDIIITKMDAMDVEWTKKNVYIQAYEEEIIGYDDDDDDDHGSIYQTIDDDTPCDLYCMDLDGKNMERIAD